jgi:hypothetical protein
MMAKIILNDGSIPMEGNLNFRGNSILNVKEILPQSTGSSNLGRSQFRWNHFANIVNTPNFNVETNLIKDLGNNQYAPASDSASEVIEGGSLSYGVGSPPLNELVATKSGQSKIFLTDSSVLLMFSETNVGDKITEWTSPININKDEVNITELNVGVANISEAHILTLHADNSYTNILADNFYATAGTGIVHTDNIHGRTAADGVVDFNCKIKNQNMATTAAAAENYELYCDTTDSNRIKMKRP